MPNLAQRDGRGRLTGGLATLAVWLLASSSGAWASDYESQVKSVLKKHCFACHGALRQEANLRLDTAAAILKGGDSGPAIKPGDPAGSLIVERISATDASERMPQEAEPLKAEQITAIRAWIEGGAKGPADEQPEPDPRNHWAFKRPTRPELPSSIVGVSSPVDAILSREHLKRGLTPLGPASKTVLLRRLYLDLVGLPPTRDQQHEFGADDSPDAYERTVDRLLASPAYGERWARHWMDVWRYSDWYGRRSVPDVMNSYPQIWRWRDWIIRSLNEDKGYDRMVMEMLAADEIAPEDEEALPATGFVVRNWFKWNYDQWMKDQTEHTAKAFLGLTMNCALCHDHKYDPISQKDYFAFRAVFEPLELRHDRIAGEPDPGPFKKYVYAQSYGPIASGRIRIFDEKLEAQTFIYRGGDQRQRIDGKPPVEPGVPAALGGEKFAASAVDLPPRAWYPGLKPFVQQEEIAKRQAAIPIAESELAAARQNLDTKQAKLKDAVAQAEKALETARNESAQTPQVGALSGKQSLMLDAAQGRRALAHKIPGLTSVDDKTVVSYVVQILKDAHTNFQLGIDIEKGATGGWVGFEGGKILSYKPGAFEQIEIGKYDLAKGQGKFAVALLLDPANEKMTATVKSLSDEAILVDRAAVTLKGWNGPRTDKQGIFLDARPGSVALYDDFVLGRRKDDGSVEPVVKFDFEEPAYPLGKEIAGIDGWMATGYCSAPATSIAGVPASSTPVVQAKEKELLVARRASQTLELAVKVAEAKLAAAQSELTSIQTRISADNCRYGFAAGNADELALAAANAERQAALLSAQANLVAAEKALAEAEAKPLTDAARDKAIQTAQAQLAPARKALDDAASAAAKTDATYTPLSPTFPKQSTGRRTALARWIASQENPLTARVAVNHLWGRHFGRPIVESTANFGRSGKPPMSQPLIDCLAVELMDGEWTMKRMHRKIVGSDAYRRSSASGGRQLASGGREPPDSASLDPDNKFLWHFPTIRIEAEVVRDSLLAVADQLDLTLGGKEIDIAQGFTSHRRSLYFSHHGEAKMEFLDLFDGASPTDCYVRTTSIRPQQALALANSELVLAQARVLAKELAGPIASLGPAVHDGPVVDGRAKRVGDRKFIIAAFETILCRPPSEQETTMSLEFLATQRSTLAAAQVADATGRSRESLVHALLNHNDFVTVR